MNKVYQVKLSDDVRDKLLDLGWEKVPYEVRLSDGVYIKPIKFDKKSEPANYAINVMNSEKWQKAYLSDKKKRELYNDLNVKFKKINKKGQYRLVKCKETYEFVCTWYLYVDFNEENVWVGFSPIDINLPDFFIADMIDRYCPNEIKELLDNDIASLLYVSNE